MNSNRNTGFIRSSNQTVDISSSLPGVSTSRSTAERITNIEASLKQVRKTQQKADSLYKELKNEQGSLANLVYIGLLVIALTAASMILTFFGIVYSVFFTNSNEVSTPLYINSEGINVTF